MSVLAKVGVQPTVYLEDLDIKLIINCFDQIEQKIKYTEVPPSVATNYYWEIYTTNKGSSQKYTTYYCLRSKHYGITKGIGFFIEGEITPSCLQ